MQTLRVFLLFGGLLLASAPAEAEKPPAKSGPGKSAPASAPSASAPSASASSASAATPAREGEAQVSGADKAAQVKGDVKVQENQEGIKSYTFGALELEGRLKSPQILYFLRRVRAEFDPSGLGHRSFMRELSDTRRSRAVR
jgi:hypothetical protein